MKHTAEDGVGLASAGPAGAGLRITTHLISPGESVAGATAAKEELVINKPCPFQVKLTSSTQPAP